MRIALVLGLALAACASPDVPEAPADTAPLAAPAADAFDVQAWLAEARAVPSDDLDARKAHAALLKQAVDWPRACDTYVDPETGETVYEPTPPGGIARGDFDVTEVGEGEAVVAVVCYFGAYQGSYALVWVDGADARLLSAPALGADGTPLEAREQVFSTPALDRFADGTVETFAKARGLGDCGTLTRYAHDGDGALRVAEVRQRDCGDDIPDDLPPPDAWPVVYTAE